MDITPENLVYHELIGLPVQVETPPYLVSGTVVDETRNMLVIGNGKARGQSPQIVLLFRLYDTRRPPRESPRGLITITTRKPDS